MGSEERETIELQNHRAMIELPEDTVSLMLTAKVYHEGELVTVGMGYSISEIREMFRKADDGYIDDDDRFVLTDRGKAFLEEIGKRKQ